MRFLALLLLVAAPAFGQSLPDKPVAHTKVKLISDSTGRHVSFSLRVPHRTVDKAFVEWSAISQAVTIADVLNTEYCLRWSTCQEMNPMYGRRPGLARMLLISEAIYGVNEWMAWRVKRRDDAAIAFGAKVDRTDRWWLIPAVHTIFHGAGVAITLAQTGK